MMYDLTIATIATNKYLDFLLGNLYGLAAARKGLGSTQVVIFTNNPGGLPDSYKNLDLKFVEIENFGWPEITLLRYEILSRNAEALMGSRIMWLDADMLIVKPLDVGKVVHDATKVYLARHPGFIGGAPNVHLPLKKRLKGLLTKMNNLAKGQIGQGTWEERQASLAYVPNFARRTYVHGAVWIGPAGPFLEMCRTLAERTRQDLEKGVIALWHDESHLNWYLANFPERCELLPKHFSAWEDGLWYEPTESWVLSVDKSKW
jgi:hypothetical protein